MDYRCRTKHIAKSLYAANNLAYHNWEHVEYMLTRVHADFEFVDERLEEAIVWHDVVYNPYEKDNEEKSAKLYQLIHENKRPNKHIEVVKSLIMATKTHTVPHNIQEQHRYMYELIIDLDLYGLSESFKVFNDNTQRIRSEWSAVSNQEFAEGRKKFFEGMLNRKIYQSGFYADREEIAKNNIRKALYMSNLNAY